MSALGYPYKMESISLHELTQRMGVKQKNQVEMVKTWIMEEFNRTHFDAMLKSPVFEYDRDADMIVCRKEETNE